MLQRVRMGIGFGRASDAQKLLLRPIVAAILSQQD
jgi:hypothetical protein